jgi:hypothetical protein
VASRANDSLIGESFSFAIAGRLFDHPELLSELLPRMEAPFAAITTRGTLREMLGRARDTLSDIEGAHETPARNDMRETPTASRSPSPRCRTPRADPWRADVAPDAPCKRNTLAPHATRPAWV